MTWRFPRNAFLQKLDQPELIDWALELKHSKGEENGTRAVFVMRVDLVRQRVRVEPLVKFAQPIKFPHQNDFQITIALNLQLIGAARQSCELS